MKMLRLVGQQGMNQFKNDDITFFVIINNKHFYESICCTDGTLKRQNLMLKIKESVTGWLLPTRHSLMNNN